ncbi:hypothetical protein F5887DRAFT_133201 [Amanita rubescens]|nr:hypothetical protein F5887DRAFT_133201 [Amanita rubescens]
MHQIVQGQKVNDVESFKPKGVRLGYMGHLTLIAEDVLVTLERYPPDLRRYNETKERDSSMLGGGKPAVTGTTQRAFSKWQVDEDDSDGFNGCCCSGDDEPTEMAGGGIGGVGHGARSLGSGHGFGLAGSTAAAAATINNSTLGMTPGNEVKTEFNKRLGSGHPPRVSTADFGSLPGPAGYGDVPEEEEEEGNSSAPRFASYLAQEMHSSEVSYGGGSSSSDDEDEEVGGWLSQSTFGLGVAAAPQSSTLSPVPPITTTRHSLAMGPLSGVERRPLSSVDARFDDSFDPTGIKSSFTTARGLTIPASGASSVGAGHVRARAQGSPFNVNDDDDEGGFGPFSDAHAAANQGNEVVFGSGLHVRHPGGPVADVGSASVAVVGGMDGEDPFGFSSSFSDDGDGSFGDFGDFGEFHSADADGFGDYDGDGQDEHDHDHGNWNRVGVHVEVVGRGGGAGAGAGVNRGEGEFTLTPTATTGSWTFAEDGSPNPSPGMDLAGSA